MLTFRFMGSVKYSEELNNKEGHIGDCYFVLYEGKKTDERPTLVNCLYCYDGGWVRMDVQSKDHIEYIVHTLVNLSKFKSETIHFETDTVVVLAEKNNTAGNLTILNIWPEILFTPEMAWQLIRDIYDICDNGNPFKTENHVEASIEYNRQITEVIHKKESEE